MQSSIKPLLLGLAVLLSGPAAAQAALEREPVTMSVVAVNPSEAKTQTVPVRVYLPKEVTPADIVENAGLTLEFDDDQSIYYLYKEGVELAPKETKVFDVIVRDVWYVPEDRVESLRTQTHIVLDRLAASPYYESAKERGARIEQRLDEILTVQNDESLGRKTRIGAYRNHLVTLEQIKEEIAQLEKLLSFAGGTPVPQMLEESKIKSDAPSTKTTWMLILLVVAFVGLLGGQFFFAWHRKATMTDVTSVKQLAFPEDGSGEVKSADAPGGTKAA